MSSKFVAMKSNKNGPSCIGIYNTYSEAIAAIIQDVRRLVAEATDPSIGAAVSFFDESDIEGFLRYGDHRFSIRIYHQHGQIVELKWRIQEVK